MNDGRSCQRARQGKISILLCGCRTQPGPSREGCGRRTIGVTLLVLWLPGLIEEAMGADVRGRERGERGGRMGGWVDGWMDGWMDRWIDG